MVLIVFSKKILSIFRFCRMHEKSILVMFRTFLRKKIFNVKNYYNLNLENLK